MKRILPVLLAILGVVDLAACNKPHGNNNAAVASSSTSVPVATGNESDSITAAITQTQNEKTQANKGFEDGKAVQAQATDFSWLIGKYPYDVIKDARFRAAFPSLTKQQWLDVAARLDVASPVELKDGYYVGSGIMQHAGGSDEAAFVISSLTGKGDIVYAESVNSGETVHVYAWPDMPAANTPLVQWAKESNFQLDSSSPNAQQINSNAIDWANRPVNMPSNASTWTEAVRTQLIKGCERGNGGTPEICRCFGKKVSEQYAMFDFLYGMKTSDPEIKKATTKIAAQCVADNS